MIPESPGIMKVIYGRRAIRDFKNKKLDEALIYRLLDAAVQAPTALYQQAWRFSIIQDKSVLKRLSDTAKELLKNEKSGIQSSALKPFMEPDFNVFYNAGTLIVIWGPASAPFIAADCWLAAENLMLAACGMKLGSCVIGLAVAALNTPQWKKELGAHPELIAVAPIILGYPAKDLAHVARETPVILEWEHARSGAKSP